MRKSVLTGSAALAAMGGATLAGCAPTPPPYVPPVEPPAPTLGCYATPVTPINADLKLVGAPGTLNSIEIHGPASGCADLAATHEYLAAVDATAATAACTTLDPGTTSVIDLAPWVTPEPLAGYFICSDK